MTSAGTPWGEPRRDALNLRRVDTVDGSRGVYDGDRWVATFKRVADLEEYLALRAQAAAHAEDLQVAREIGASFFEALKPLNLQAINVANPGQHVTDLIALVARLGESLKWDHNTQGPNHVRSSCDVCAFLAELAPATPTP